MNGTEEQATPSTPTKASNFVVRFWRGEYSLAVSFWLFGFVTKCALYAAAVFTVFVAVPAGADEHQRVLATLPGALTLLIWYSGGLWVSADNHVERTGRRGWATGARVVLFIGWFSFVGEIIEALS